MLKKLFKKIWKDPVGSTIISTVIIASSAVVLPYVSEINYSDYTSISLPLWCILIIGFLPIVLGKLFKSYKNKKLSNLSRNDIKILLSNWRPAQDIYGQSIFVRYSDVDRELKLPSGSTKSLIFEVAREKYYKPVEVGDSLAEFRADLERVMNSY